MAPRSAPEVNGGFHVSDWAYRDAAGVVQGHRTTRVLLPRLEAGEAQAIREAFGWTK